MRITMTHSHNSHFYQAYGLTISSEIEFPELIPLPLSLKSAIDVDIRESTFATCQYEFDEKEELYWQAADGVFFMSLKDIAKFQVTDGRLILLERYGNCDLSQVRPVILGTCLGIILHQKGLLPIHGCAIATKYGGKIFAGPVGIGKSTLAAAFMTSGYKILADDVSTISPATDRPPQVFPSYPQLKLCPDSAEQLNIVTDTLVPIDDPEKLKFAYPLFEQYFDKPVKVSAIYFLETSLQDHFELQTLSGMEKFTYLRNNTYREIILDAIQVNSSHFQLCTLVANQIPMYLLKRPRSLCTIHQLVAFLENHFSAAPVTSLGK